MQRDRRQYSFTSEYKNGRFSRGPITIEGLNIFIDPTGYGRAVTGEVARLQEEIYASLGIPAMYMDGKLVERRQGSRASKGHRGHHRAIPGSYTIPELQKCVEELIKA